ncbi:MAG: YdeI/OmpD-associated family protein [Bacteroidia bacterium]
MKQFKFKAKISRPEGVGTWHFANVPIDVEKEFGKKGQVKVKASVNGKVFYNSLMPHGNGKHYIVLGEQIRTQAGVKVGDTINMTIEADNRARTVELPEDFELALAKNKVALEFFSSLSYTYKKQYADWIASAKREETRADRIVKAIEKLANKEKLD